MKLFYLISVQIKIAFLSQYSQNLKYNLVCDIKEPLKNNKLENIKFLDYWCKFYFRQYIF